MEWNRWDIVEAHYWFAVHYHGGQNSELYARQCRIGAYFSPGRGGDGPTTFNACEVYNALERKHGFKETPYEVLPCGECQLIDEPEQ